ncbi:hypothetical protein AB0K09_19010 [Streptomyces sp. NPDC049577]|uniref:hypothetical protein n=1 Tax=Streptomyces sp. NPDC049577 TaxID=3155153 RepID=UPI003443E0FF
MTLDDARFQDLVDDARQYLRHHCPQWTDHNVSDPGIVLLEAGAQMVDALSYRLDALPERVQWAVLRLLGLDPAPAVPGRGCEPRPVKLRLVGDPGAKVPEGASVYGDGYVARTDQQAEFVATAAFPVCDVFVVPSVKNPTGKIDVMPVEDRVKRIARNDLTGCQRVVGPTTVSRENHMVALRVRVEGAATGTIEIPVRGDMPEGWDASWFTGVQLAAVDMRQDDSRAKLLLARMCEDPPQQWRPGEYWFFLIPRPGAPEFTISRRECADGVRFPAAAVPVRAVIEGRRLLLGTGDGRYGQRFGCPERPVRVVVGGTPYSVLDSFPVKPGPGQPCVHDPLTQEIRFNPGLREDAGEFGEVPPEHAPVFAVFPDDGATVPVGTFTSLAAPYQDVQVTQDAPVAAMPVAPAPVVPRPALADALAGIRLGGWGVRDRAVTAADYVWHARAVPGVQDASAVITGSAPAREARVTVRCEEAGVCDAVRRRLQEVSLLGTTVTINDGAT